ncbi:MAG: hypothetical protein IT437_14000 [Phycisphaerales bacterium]|nr:hypothetical protein [Phycisphaerales bacterium]
MDLSHPWLLMSGFLIGSAGFLLLLRGKRELDVPSMVAGLTLCVFPYFVGSMLVLWLGTAACLGGLYAWTRTSA